MRSRTHRYSFDLSHWLNQLYLSQQAQRVSPSSKALTLRRTDDISTTALLAASVPRVNINYNLVECKIHVRLERPLTGCVM